MTRQEIHNYDVCGELFYVPQDPLRTLEINRDLDDEICCDLCFDCHRKLLAWILEVRKAAEEKKPHPLI